MYEFKIILTLNRINNNKRGEILSIIKNLNQYREYTRVVHTDVQEVVTLQKKY